MDAWRKLRKGVVGVKFSKEELKDLVRVKEVGVYRGAKVPTVRYGNEDLGYYLGCDLDKKLKLSEFEPDDLFDIVDSLVLTRRDQEANKILKKYAEEDEG